MSRRTAARGVAAGAGGKPYGAGMASVRTVSPPVEVTPGARPPTAADFPGCKPVRLPREELDHGDVRLEYWDAATETAWICDPVSSYHEGPAHGAWGGWPTASPRCAGAGGVLRPHRPDRARRGRRAAPHHAGRPVGVPAPGARPAAAAGADGRRARLPGRGAGGGPHHRRAAAQAAAVRGVGVPGAVGRGAGGRCAEPSAEPALGADHPPAGGWGVPGRRRRAGRFPAGRRRRFTRR